MWPLNYFKSAVELAQQLPSRESRSDNCVGASANA
jgi:hypothetical protein